MICCKCSAELLDNSAFCNRCGAPTAAAETGPSASSIQSPQVQEAPIGYKQKSITVSGFTRSHREVELAKVRKKFESRGWIFVDYRDKFTRGEADFHVPDYEMQRLRLRNWLIGGGIAAFVVLISLLPNVPDSPNKDGGDKSLMSRNVPTPTSAPETFTAIFSCGVRGQNINVIACFSGTQLKITINNRSRIFNAPNIRDAGVIYPDGLHIDLPEHFLITAQNSEETLILGIKILDKSNNIIFEDQAGMYDVIKVRN